MNKRIVLVGKSCTGKSTLGKLLEFYGFKSQISTTTRPIRTGETNNIDYHFVSLKVYESMIKSNSFIESVKFNGYYYGITHEDYQTADILLLTPAGLQKYLTLFGRENFLIIYLDASISLRLSRIASRDDESSNINKRWVSDENDFENWEQWGMTWDIKISQQTEHVIPILINIIKNKIIK